MHPNRLELIKSISLRNQSQLDRPIPKEKISEFFGSMTFSLTQAEKFLTKEAFAQFVALGRGEIKMDQKLAVAVADGVKAWALSLGATHFTHWFQPNTGLSAEKHDSFINTTADGKVIEKFSAGQLIQSEPDASSFPSGGMRSTFEARGYTAWDTTSPIFIVEYSGSRILCIPSVFVSYTGHTLDTKTGLIRSIGALNRSALELLREIGDTKVKNVSATLGCEQEYFLVDQEYVSQRPDLLLTGRTLLGAPSPKGQQLEDHYFRAIPSRVLAFMRDVESELYRLGVPVKTRHNEVAPSQFEMAPIFEETNRGSDHNMLSMEVLRRVAEQHNFRCLLHEKPFEGVNGSGKHCNWSLSTDAGENLLDPGSTPHENFRFIAVLACVLRAVFRGQVALRTAIATNGNDHRLGANEAPPAIISVFLGSFLTSILEKLESGGDFAKTSAEKAHIDFGLSMLPSIPKDNTDRNRTSPFAFTGNKFEFRAVGSSQTVAFPVTVLNAAVASSLDEFTRRLKQKKIGAASVDSAVLAVAKEFFEESKHIRFEGDGYSEAWRVEARRRGLFELLQTPESFEAFLKPEHHSFLTEQKIFTAEEIHAIADIRLERYTKFLEIEAQTLCMMVRQSVIPSGQAAQVRMGDAIRASDLAGTGAAKSQRWLLGEVVKLTEQCFDGVNRVLTEVKAAAETSKLQESAQRFSQKVLPAMKDLRQSCDRLETMVPDEVWSLPKYREMLFQY